MISTSEVVSRVTQWWQQTMKDVVIVRADFLKSLSSISHLRKRKNVGGAKADFEDFLTN